MKKIAVLLFFFLSFLTELKCQIELSDFNDFRNKTSIREHIRNMFPSLTSYAFRNTLLHNSNKHEQTRNTPQYLDSVFVDNFDETSWYLYYYNDSLLLETEYQKLKFDTLWFPFMKTQFDYDAHLKITGKVFWRIRNLQMEWDSILIMDYKYDSNEMLTEESWVIRDDSTGKWIPEALMNYQYDSNGNLSQINSAETWDTAAADWKFKGKVTFSFDNNKHLLEYFDEEWDRHSDTWNYESKYIYQYDSLGKKTQMISYRYEDTLWMPTSKDVFIVDANDQWIATDLYNWDKQANNWKLSNFKETYLYDIYGNCIEGNWLRWNDSSMTWEDDIRTERSYNTNYSYSDLVLPHHGYLFTFFYSSFFQPHPYHDFDLITPLFNSMLLSSESKRWLKDFSTWKTWDERRYYYSDHIIGISEKAYKSTIHVYPNPARDYITVELPQKTDFSIFELYDLAGKRVFSIQSKERTLRLSGIAPGFYVYRILTEEKEFQGKLIISQ
jgi:hypothetical protein